MLKEFLKGNVQIVDNISSWEEAIKLSAKPLLDNKNIDGRYIDAMINNVHKNGPYMVLLDGVCMPHSRPEDGAIKNGMALLKVRGGVDFYKTDKKVYLFFALAAVSSDEHTEAIAELADFLGDDDKLSKIINSEVNEEDILAVL